MKLHVGCGTVYLQGWTNIDLPLPHIFIASERPDLVERFITNEENYYGRHPQKNIDVWRKGPITQASVCDAYGYFHFLPARDDTVTEILSRQCFEHMTVDRAGLALKECRRVLVSGGHLRLDLPDPENTVERYRETGDRFYLRHLFGPRHNEYGFHTLYNRESLIKLAKEAGLSFMREEENPHPYPAFTLRFRAAP